MNNPWGKIIGIRPVKIVRDRLQKGQTEQEIFYYFTQVQDTSIQKTNLALDIAKRELDILKNIQDNDICLYIGIPFCKTRCLYCSFVTNTASKAQHLMQPFVDALAKEMQYTAQLLKKTNYNIVSLYIGGGTPTALPAGLLEDIIDNCFKYFDLKNLREFSVEAGRPDTIDEEKLLMLKSKNVSRISINPQTMNDKTLEFIGRFHTSRQIADCFHLARKCGFDDINMDVIAGLPRETLDDFKNTINEVERLSPESTTVHTMSIKRGSKLHETLGAYSLTDESVVTQMIDYAYSKLTSEGKNPYYLYRQKNMLGNLENIGYAKEGYECLYNILIMEEIVSIISLGSGGVTKIVNLPPGNRIERIFNVKEVYDYVNRVDEMCKRKDIMLNWLEIL